MSSKDDGERVTFHFECGAYVAGYARIAMRNVIDGLGLDPDDLVCTVAGDGASDKARIVELEEENERINEFLNKLYTQREDRLRRVAGVKDSRSTLVEVCDRQAARIADLETENKRLTEQLRQTVQVIEAGKGGR